MMTSSMMSQGGLKVGPLYSFINEIESESESEILFDNINHHTHKKAYRLPSNIYTLFNIHG